MSGAPALPGSPAAALADEPDGRAGASPGDLRPRMRAPEPAPGVAPGGAPAARRGAGGGRLVAVVGPSGAGKDTLLRAALALRPGLVLLRRIVTRPAEAGSEDFDGTDEAGFAARLAAGDFAVHWRAHGLAYAIPRVLDDHLAGGRTVLFNGSRAALPAVRARFAALQTVMVTAPRALLAARLEARGRESAAEIAGRLSRAGLAAPAGARIVVNDADIATGAARLLAALDAAPPSAASGASP